MLSLSQTTGYAILALGSFHPDGETMIMAKEIAERTGISKPYLSKILHRLGQAGLITGKRGYKGGLLLARPASEISVMEISNAIDGEEWKTRCFIGLPQCKEGAHCPMHRFWCEERPKIESILTNLTLDRVFQYKQQGWRLENKGD